MSPPGPPTAWTGATRWFAGPGSAEQAVRRSGLGPRPVLLTDAGAAATGPGAALVDRVRAALPAAPAAELAVGRSATVAELAELSSRWDDLGVTGVVAVGGGCTLDVAVLAALPPAVLGAGPLRRGRSGVVPLTASTAAAVPTVAVPTTLGTGAEVSAVACCERDGDGKLLVLGDALRPAYAAVDPAATQALPVRLVREALVEVLARILVPLCARPTGEPPVVGLSDALSLASLRHLGTVAVRIAGGDSGPDARLALATVSAHSHAGWSGVGRPADASPVWPIGTELAALTGWTKSVANGCLLPAWASAVLAGDDRWGEAGRLCTAWEALAGAVGCTESDPARGLAAVVDRWAGPQPDFPGDLPGDLPGDIAGDVGERAAMRWGTVLGRFRAAEIADVVRLALWAPTRYLAGPSTETSVSSASSGAPRPLTR